MRKEFLGALSVCLLAACGAPSETPSAAAPAEEAPAIEAAAPAPTPEPNFRLPVSLNEVMVAMVNNAADPIWMAAWKNPETDADWRALERQAYQLELAGSLIAFPGTG